MRTALWMLESDEPVDVAHAVRAANEALHRGDVALAESLARSAVGADAVSVQATVVLAQALRFQGRGDEAVAVLTDFEPSTPGDVAAAALVHGQVLGFVLGRADDAATMLERTAAQLPDAFRWQVDAERALYGAIAGDFSATFEAASAVLANEGASEEARIGAFVNLTLVQSVTGLLAELDGNVDAGLVAVDASPLPPPLAVEQLEMNRLHGWCAAGRLREAEHHSRARLASAERIGATSPMYLTWHSLMLGMRGQLVEAISAEQRALELFDGGDPLRLRPQALAMLAMHRTQAGQASVGSQQDLARARDAAGAETRLLFWVDRATAWSLVADGTLEDAARYAVALGADALARDHIVWGIWALHDAARFGHPALALPAIRSATEQTTGAPLLAAMAAHASALAGGDADRLTVVATDLAAMGSPLFAAEASAQASRLREQAGDVVAACRAAFRSALWSDHCDGAATPALLDVAEGLTTREVEVARLVSAGAPSQAAAETLFVSVRTVDNHLRSIYRKLGVRGRGDLADIVLGIDEVGRS
jgi:DNA-binding NarL/FixJ family response regulator